MAADCLEARARAPWTRLAEPVSIAFALGLGRGHCFFSGAVCKGLNHVEHVEFTEDIRGLERLKGSLDRPCLPFAEVVPMGCCIGARTSQPEAGDQEFQSGPRYSLTAVGLAYDMDAGRVFFVRASNREVFSKSCKLSPYQK